MQLGLDLNQSVDPVQVVADLGVKSVLSLKIKKNRLEKLFRFKLGCDRSFQLPLTHNPLPS